MAAGIGEPGKYLTDRARLLLVLDAAERVNSHEAMLLLEDCSFDCDDAPVFWLPVKQILAEKWKRVLPAGDEEVAEWLAARCAVDAELSPA